MFAGKGKDQRSEVEIQQVHNKVEIEKQRLEETFNVNFKAFCEFTISMVADNSTLTAEEIKKIKDTAVKPNMHLKDGPLKTLQDIYKNQFEEAKTKTLEECSGILSNIAKEYEDIAEIQLQQSKRVIERAINDAYKDVLKTRKEVPLMSVINNSELLKELKAAIDNLDPSHFDETKISDFQTSLTNLLEYIVEKYQQYIKEHNSAAGFIDSEEGKIAQRTIDFLKEVERIQSAGDLQCVNIYDKKSESYTVLSIPETRTYKLAEAVTKYKKDCHSITNEHDGTLGKLVGVVVFAFIGAAIGAAFGFGVGAVFGAAIGAGVGAAIYGGGAAFALFRTTQLEEGYKGVAEASKNSFKRKQF